MKYISFYLAPNIEITNTTKICMQMFFLRPYILIAEKMQISSVMQI